MLPTIAGRASPSHAEQGRFKSILDGHPLASGSLTCPFGPDAYRLSETGIIINTESQDGPNRTVTVNAFAGTQKPINPPWKK